MIHSVQSFKYKSHDVRITEWNGKPCFVVKDVANILDFNFYSNMTRSFDEREKGKSTIHTRGGLQSVRVITLSALLNYLETSKKSEAKSFLSWVKSEVLPIIQLHQNSSCPVLVDPVAGAKIIFEAAGIHGTQLATALDKVYMTYTGTSAFKTANIPLESPAEKNSLTPTQIGLQLGFTAIEMNKILADMGFQYKIAGRWKALPPGEPYAVMRDIWTSNNKKVNHLHWTPEIISVIRAHEGSKS